VIGEPIESLVVVGRAAFVTVQWRDAQAGRVLEFSLARGVPEPARGKLSRPQALAAAAGGALVATHDRHTVLVWAPGRFGAARPLALHHTKPLTCVAISPDGAKLAAGDATGRIVVWHGVAAAVAAQAAAALDPAAALDLGGGAAAADPPAPPPDPPAATAHWHAHAVGCLAFSGDGAYLLSGGQEAVLVLWDAASGRRAYLPRLGGPLVGIVGCAGDGARYALRQADNTLRLVNAAAMRVECSVHGLRPPPRAAAGGGGAAPAPVAFQPGTGLLILAGPHATLQWYDVVRDAHADKLALSHRNVVSLTEADAAAQGGVYGAPPEPAAAALALSADGGAMATLETRPDPAGGGAVQHSLKFWDRREGGAAVYGAPYRVNTVADQPHR
jgi:NET1-associated nuclear protein 1 (U3 small nucleolar RNA-associated protein 17)